MASLSLAAQDFPPQATRRDALTLKYVQILPLLSFFIFTFKLVSSPLKTQDDILVSFLDFIPLPPPPGYCQLSASG